MDNHLNMNNLFNLNIKKLRNTLSDAEFRGELYSQLNSVPCLYEFRFNDNHYESCYTTISTHLTYKGAYKAMKKFLYEEFEKERLYSYPGSRFGELERWHIRKIKIEE